MNTEKKYSAGTIRAIIGLGNPGQGYYKTRHSIGFRVLDKLAEREQVSWQTSTDMHTAQISCHLDESGIPKTVYLIKPQTYMNNSGRVIPYLTKKGIKGDEILVIHDELEKSFGTVGIRWNGGHRGHNGLRSIMEVFGNEFWRLQFGISRPADKAMVSDYVLAPFLTQEESALGELIEKAVLLLGL